MTNNLINTIESCKSFILANTEIVNLIYYSHLSTALACLVLGFFIFWNNKTAIINRTLLLISILFSIWSVLDLITWKWAYNSQLTMISWSLLGLVYVSISITCFYFIYFYQTKKFPNIWFQILLWLPILPVLILTPTSLNLTRFDIFNCEASENPVFTYYYYFVSTFYLILTILSYFYYKNKGVEKKVGMVVVGISLFLSFFIGYGFFASYFENYIYLTYGQIGMVIFMAFLAYLIVKYKAFNIKLIGVQALVWTSVILISSQFFFIRNNTNRILTALTLVIFSIVGWLIVSSVKKEIRQKEEIAHLLKIKSEFIDIVSHQLRTPVSVIKGMASMLKEGDLDNVPKEQRDQFIAGIYEKSEKLADILNDILKAAELDMDNFAFTPASIKPVNLSQLVKGIFDDLNSLAQSKKLNYQIKISPEIANLNVMTDESFLKHVFQNVTDNAIKYSKEGSSMTIDLNKERDFFVCKIADSGIGIPENQKDRLFEKFFRAKNAVDAHAYGTGLGLFITKKIVEAHPGGKIWFDSVVNKGTTFYIKLPIAKVA